METDVDLVSACSRGDVAALRQLHQRHARAAFAFAARMLGSEADAEEAVADAFFDVWRQASRFAGQSQVRTWILGIVRHKALDILRRRGVVVSEPLEEEVIAALPDDSPSPDERWYSQQQWRIVEACLDALPPAQRECLYLTLVEGLTLAEIASLLGVPVNTVATRIHHAKRKLMACVGAAIRQ